MFLVFSKIFVFFRVGGPKVHKVSGGRAQGSQAACDVLRIAIDLKLGYCGNVSGNNTEGQTAGRSTRLKLYRDVNPGTATERIKWQKKN